MKRRRRRLPLRKSMQPRPTPKKDVMMAKRQNTWMVTAIWGPTEAPRSDTMSLTHPRIAPGGREAKIKASHIRYIISGIDVPKMTADLTASADPR